MRGMNVLKYWPVWRHEKLKGQLLGRNTEGRNNVYVVFK
jgi:hypothetical protein